MPPPFLADSDLTVYCGDAVAVLGELEAETANCVVTSPPYWGLRDYGAEGQIGLEPTLDDFVEKMVEVFREVRRVLRSDGTCWLNLGDSYLANQGYDNPAGHTGKGGGRKFDPEVARPTAWGGASRTSTKHPTKPKDLAMMPALVALALRADGWWLRSQIVWSKPNPMPESCTDRPTQAYELVYLLTRSARYFFDREAAREPFEAKSAGSWSRATYEARNEVPAGKNGAYRREYHHPLLHGPPQEETLGDLPGEAPRGADGRRKTTRVEHHDGRMSHENYANAYGGERWPGGGRNIRNVWEIATQPTPEAHFATFPEELVRRCVEAGCPAGGVVLDPFAGSGTVGLVARRLGRQAILIELNPDYCEIISRRTQQLSLLAAEE